MQLTENDFAVLRALHTYYLLTATLLHNLVFPQNRDRRGTRRRLQRLVTHHFIARSRANVCFSTGNAGPAYHLTDKGADALAVYFDDPAFLHTNTKSPRTDRLYHWLDIARAHMQIRLACERSPHVELIRWVNEWCAMVDEHGNPTDYVLHTQFREGPKPLSCSPDAAFVLSVNGHRRVHFVEVDRGTTGAKRVAASKMPGYAEMLRTQAFLRRFPESTFPDFSVLLVAPTSNRRNILRTCVANHPQLHPELWYFLAFPELTPESVLHADVVFDIDGNCGPLVSLPGAAS
ncbi:MAG: replication-relaxation family protein [Planctomycetaceae bacterium]